MNILSDKITTITDLIKRINVDSSIVIKTPKELLDIKDYSLIEEAFKVVTKYRSHDWMSEISESELQSDIIYLQCTVVLLSEKISLIGSYQDFEEDKVKTARAKIRLALKQMKQEADTSGPSKITQEDIKDASIALTEELSDKFENLKIGTNFIKFVFYSLKDQVSYLDKALHRMYSFIPEKMKKQDLANEPRFATRSVSMSDSGED